MPVPSPVSSPNKATMRASGYWNSSLVILCPNTVIFACRADEDITDAPFAQFAYDTVTVGAFGYVLPGMVFYISSSNDIRAAKYRGRVRKDLTSSIFYCDENATTLNSGDYIFVCRDVDLFAKIRRDTLMDFDIAFHKPEPQISDLPSVMVFYDSDNDGLVTFAPIQTGVAVAQGASISSWLWTISGDGTTAYTTGSSTSQHPVIDLQAGFEYLIRCRVTDSNGVPHFQFIRVYAVDFNLTALVALRVVAGDVSHDLENGFTASITAYADVSTLIDRTFAVVFSLQVFGDGSTTAIRSNIFMHGRLRSESISVAGSAEAGVLSEVTFPIEGIASYLQRLKIPEDIIRDVAVPDEWGELTQPNPYRILCYMMDNYTTLTNLCSFTAGSSLFVRWRIGGEPSGVDGGSALDVLNSVLDRIKAGLNFAPDGEIYMEQMVSYQVDRSAVQTVIDFSESTGDYTEFAISRDSSRTTAQVTAWGGVFNSANGTFTLFTAMAPSIIYGDGGESVELTREILEFDSTPTDAETELAARAGDHYAALNPKPMLRVTFKGGFSLLLVATSFQRWTHTIDASSNVRNIAYTADNLWQLQSVNITINRDGSLNTTGEFVAETELSDAQTLASLLPENLSGLPPQFPVLSDDPAFPDSELQNYPTDNPTIDELQSVDPYSGYLGYSPFTADEAAKAAKKQPTPNCFVTQVNMRNSGTTLGKTTVNTNPYTMTIQGSGQIAAAGWIQSFDFLAGQQGWSIYLSHGGTYLAGTGWKPSTFLLGVYYNEVFITIPIPGSPVTLTLFSVTYSKTAGAFTGGAANDYLNYNGINALTSQVSSTSAGTNRTFGWNGSQSGVTDVAVQMICDASLTNPPGGDETLKHITLGGDGANPFTGAPGGGISADAFYFYPTDSTDPATAQVFDPTAGFLIDGNKPAVIPAYNPSHEYTVPYTGTGNPLQLNYALADYSTTQNRLITVTTCKDA